MRLSCLPGLLLFLSLADVQAIRPPDAPRIDFTDTAMLPSRQPILVAHRGGVITATAAEGSLSAIRLAALDGYDMVELDIQSTQDERPVVFHDRNLKEDTGREGKVSDLSFEEITAIPYLGLDETIPSLRAALQLCRELDLGVMLDFKTEGTEAYYQYVLDCLVECDLLDSTITISSKSSVRTFFKGKIWFRILNGDGSAPEGQYMFDRASAFDREKIKELHEKGLFAIPALNTFHYPPENNVRDAGVDAERLLHAGADGFQIDSVYQHFFGLPRRPMPGFED
jgi:glycerophosphoryl diester phosphodiesterase